MLKKLKILVLHSLQRRYFLAVPSIVPYGIIEFLIFRISPSKTDCYCLPIILSIKEEIYINFRVLLTRVKQFNCFLCKTTYSELFKELIIKYYTNILSLVKRNTLNILGELLNVFTTFRQCYK